MRYTRKLALYSTILCHTIYTQVLNITEDKVREEENAEDDVGTVEAYIPMEVRLVTSVVQFVVKI